MIDITREFEWDMGHRVTNHSSLCKNPHGHRYRMQVTVTGLVNDSEGASSQGMILDFGVLKKLVNKHIVDEYDHSFVYWGDDVVMKSFAADNPGLRMHELSFVPTAEMLVQFFADQILHLLKKEAPSLQLRSVVLFETPKSSATWRSED